MAIYMKLDKITGPVQTGPFKDTIELTSFSTGASRHLSQPTRSEQNRGHAEADIDMVFVSKLWDGVSSAKLFQSVAKGEMDMTATISFTNADTPASTYLEVCLTNAAIARYSVRGSGGAATDLPTEDLTISFTAIQWTPYTVDSKGKPTKGGMVKMDLPTGTLS
ncbi:MAG: type VI secretion system tube protein Hcp [Acetobacteraceae bacterium]|nr:type VI secretion system tube protein Hcp [Acetobacteraceae bacterium]